MISVYIKAGPNYKTKLKQYKWAYDDTHMWQLSNVFERTFVNILCDVYLTI